MLKLVYVCQCSNLVWRSGEFLARRLKTFSHLFLKGLSRALCVSNLTLKREMFEGVRGVRDVTRVARSPPADCAAAGVVNQPVNQHPTKEGYFRANV